MSDQNDTVATEVWKPVVGFEGYYEVSDRGRVRSLDRVVIRTDGVRQPQVGRLLSQQPLKHGRLSVHLCGHDLSHHRLQVHRLVLEAFVGPCPEGMETCHADDDCTNNTLGNLRWDTKRNNMLDRDRNGKTVRGSGHGNAKVNEDDVRAMRLRHAAGETTTALAGQFGISWGRVAAIVRRESWKHVDG